MHLKSKIIISIILNLISFATYATVWPVFTAPDEKFLLNNNYIDTQQCPRGQGKLVADISLNIHSSFCKTYCPEDWNWIAQSDGQCHDLNEFTLQKFSIEHIRNEDGTTDHSVIIASYGKSDEPSLFTFTFVSANGEYWDCYEMNSSLHLLSCANDI